MVTQNDLPSVVGEFTEFTSNLIPERRRITRITKSRDRTAEYFKIEGGQMTIEKPIDQTLIILRVWGFERDAG